MKNVHENVLDRASNSLDYYKSNKLAIDAVDALKGGFITLDTLYTLITGKRSAGELDTSLFTEQKSGVKDKAALVAVSCAGPLRSYAKAKGLTTVLSEVPAAATDYKQGRDKLVLNRYETLRRHYAALLPDMRDYNTDEAKLQLLDDTIADIKKVINAPGSVIKERKLTNAEIDDTVKEINALFRDMLNPIMDGFAIDDPKLYKGWLEASRVVHVAASHDSPEEAAAKREAKEAVQAAKAEERAAAKAAKAEEKAAIISARAAAKLAARPAAKTSSKSVQPPTDSDDRVEEVPMLAPQKSNGVEHAV